MKPLRSQKAMIVEDEPMFARQLGRAIEQLGGGWQFEHFRAAGPVIEHLDRRIFYADLALIDLGLPDVSGLEVIRQAHKRLPEMPILVVSAINAESSVLAAIKAGARGYL